MEMASMEDDTPSPGAMVRDFEQIVDALQKAKRLVSDLPPATKHVLAVMHDGGSRNDNVGFIDELDGLISVAERARRIDVPHGSKRFDGNRVTARKHGCALHARNVLLDFSRKKPALTKGGSFFELASIFWEIVSGEKVRDLSKYCKAVGTARSFTT